MSTHQDDGDVSAYALLTFPLAHQRHRPSSTAFTQTTRTTSTPDIAARYTSAMQSEHLRIRAVRQKRRLCRMRTPNASPIRKIASLPSLPNKFQCQDGSGIIQMHVHRCRYLVKAVVRTLSPSLHLTGRLRYKYSLLLFTSRILQVWAAPGRSARSRKSQTHTRPRAGCSHHLSNSIFDNTGRMRQGR